MTATETSAISATRAYEPPPEYVPKWVLNTIAGLSLTAIATGRRLVRAPEVVRGWQATAVVDYIAESVRAKVVEGYQQERVRLEEVERAKNEETES